MAITGKFVIAGIDIFDKKVYACGNGKWSEKKSEAKVFNVGESTSAEKKNDYVTKIRVEWV